MQLLPFIESASKQNGTSRVVVVSSELHWLSYAGTIRFNDINSKEGYGESTAYGQSKVSSWCSCEEDTIFFFTNVPLALGLGCEHSLYEGAGQEIGRQEHSCKL
jgi:hypothetical protein